MALSNCTASSWLGVRNMLKSSGADWLALRVFCLCFCLSFFLVRPAFALQVVDDLGVPLNLDKPPQRIVSLLPSLTESVCALSQCQRLVGVDEYSNFPASVRQLPLLGSGLVPSIEAIVALKPDLVLLAGSSRASQRLQSLGIKVLALEPKTHADLLRVLKTLGEVLGLPSSAALQLWQGIDAQLKAVTASLSPNARGSRVYIEVGRGPYAAGESSFIGQTLARLGARNIVPAALGPFPQLNPEFVLAADPDVLIVSSRSSEGLVLYPGWASMRAVRAGRVCVLSPEQADMVVRPGPRLADGARLIAKCLEEHKR
jgi:iron complex transport system substrate-binding protein